MSLHPTKYAGQVVGGWWIGPAVRTTTGYQGKRVRVHACVCVGCLAVALRTVPVIVASAHSVATGAIEGLGCTACAGRRRRKAERWCHEPGCGKPTRTRREGGRDTVTRCEACYQRARRNGRDASGAPARVGSEALRAAIEAREARRRARKEAVA